MSMNIEQVPQETALQPASAPLAFEQQPRESNRAFAAFRVYLDMGGARSLAATGVKLGKGKRQMEKWSKKFDWGVRVKAYASYLGEVERQTDEDDRDGLPGQRAGLHVRVVVHPCRHRLSASSMAYSSKGLISICFSKAASASASASATRASCARIRSPFPATSWCRSWAARWFRWGSSPA